ncbi:hypothetical protein CYMTET_17262 [Cymbomonas tetramitiformis]|uniref:Integrator complex subunit 1 RPB2-binding domain-containing protein n=1 Tax=Cymbomonas tetramitiformis TaxID=36881 RepID=A0AAE0GAR8_9CHLO|nr:hypothetical protein CYMTET_17262 [Cymbomonas tetramitiformis]
MSDSEQQGKRPREELPSSVTNKSAKCDPCPVLDINLPPPEEENTVKPITVEPSSNSKDETAPSPEAQRRVSVERGSALAEALPITPEAENLGLASRVSEALSNEDIDLARVDALLTNAIEGLSNPATGQLAAKYFYLSIALIAKRSPSLMLLPSTYAALLNLLRQTPGGARRSPTLPTLAAVVLCEALASVPSWPVELALVYLEDAFGSRVWIDQENCKGFVANLLTAFPKPPASSGPPSDQGEAPTASAPHGGASSGAHLDATKADEGGLSTAAASTAARLLSGGGDKARRLQAGCPKGGLDRNSISAGTAQGSLSSNTPAPHSAAPGTAAAAQDAAAAQVPVMARFAAPGAMDTVRAKFVELQSSFIKSSASRENPRNTLRLYQLGTCYPAGRQAAANVLETFINSSSHFRAARLLLDCVLDNTTTDGAEDLHTVATLLSMRLKPLHAAMFTEIVGRLVGRRREYGALALKLFVTAEVQSKNPHNLKCIANTIMAMPSGTAENEIASLLQELAAGEEARPHLRGLVRRLWRACAQHLKAAALARGLLQSQRIQFASGRRGGRRAGRGDPGVAEMQAQSHAVKEAWLAQVIDLLCMVLLLGASGEVDAAAAHSFRWEVAGAQRDAVMWCQNLLCKYLPGLEAEHLTLILRRLLFVQGPDAYFTAGETYGDSEHAALSLLQAGMPVHEDMLTRICLMGLVDTYPLSRAEALGLLECCVERAARLHCHDHGVLQVSMVAMLEAVFKLAQCDVQLPASAGDPAPSLLVHRGLFWRAAVLTAVLAALNFPTLGEKVWRGQMLPSVRHLLEVLITHSQEFPACAVPQEAARLRAASAECDAADRQVAAHQRRICEEAEVAVPEEGEVMVLDLYGLPRAPPSETLNVLLQRDSELGLGAALRAEPGLLADMAMQAGGAQVAAPWLLPLLGHDHTAAAAVPAEWRAELLLLLVLQDTPGAAQTRRHLGTLLRACLTSATIDSPDEALLAARTVKFLATRLGARSAGLRAASRRCLHAILGPEGTEDAPADGDTPGGTAHWLQGALRVPMAAALVPMLRALVGRAVEREESPAQLAAYLQFLHQVGASSAAALAAARFLTRRGLLAEWLVGREGSSPPPCAELATHLAVALAAALSEEAPAGEAEAQARLEEARELEEEAACSLGEPVTVTLPEGDGRPVRRKVQMHKLLIQGAVEAVALLSPGRTQGSGTAALCRQGAASVEEAHAAQEAAPGDGAAAMETHDAAWVSPYERLRDALLAGEIDTESGAPAPVLSAADVLRLALRAGPSTAVMALQRGASLEVPTLLLVAARSDVPEATAEAALQRAQEALLQGAPLSLDASLTSRGASGEAAAACILQRARRAGGKGAAGGKGLTPLIAALEPALQRTAGYPALPAGVLKPGAAERGGEGACVELEASVSGLAVGIAPSAWLAEGPWGCAGQQGQGASWHGAAQERLGKLLVAGGEAAQTRGEGRPPQRGSRAEPEADVAAMAEPEADVAAMAEQLLNEEGGQTGWRCLHDAPNGTLERLVAALVAATVRRDAQQQQQQTEASLEGGSGEPGRRGRAATATSTAVCLLAAALAGQASAEGGGRSWEAAPGESCAAADLGMRGALLLEALAVLDPEVKVVQHMNLAGAAARARTCPVAARVGVAVLARAMETREVPHARCCQLLTQALLVDGKTSGEASGKRSTSTGGGQWPAGEAAEKLGFIGWRGGTGASRAVEFADAVLRRAGPRLPKKVQSGGAEARGLQGEALGAEEDLQLEGLAGRLSELVVEAAAAGVESAEEAVQRGMKHLAPLVLMVALGPPAALLPVVLASLQESAESSAQPEAARAVARALAQHLRLIFPFSPMGSSGAMSTSTPQQSLRAPPPPSAELPALASPGGGSKVLQSCALDVALHRALRAACGSSSAASGRESDTPEGGGSATPQHTTRALTEALALVCPQIFVRHLPLVTAMLTAAEARYATGSQAVRKEAAAAVGHCLQLLAVLPLQTVAIPGTLHSVSQALRVLCRLLSTSHNLDLAQQLCRVLTRWGEASGHDFTDLRAHLEQLQVAYPNLRWPKLVEAHSRAIGSLAPIGGATGMMLVEPPSAGGSAAVLASHVEAVRLELQEALQGVGGFDEGAPSAAPSHLIETLQNTETAAASQPAVVAPLAEVLLQLGASEGWQGTVEMREVVFRLLVRWAMHESADARPAAPVAQRQGPGICQDDGLGSSMSAGVGVMSRCDLVVQCLLRGLRSRDDQTAAGAAHGAAHVFHLCPSRQVEILWAMLQKDGVCNAGDDSSEITSLQHLMSSLMPLTARIL